MRLRLVETNRTDLVAQAIVASQVAESSGLLGRLASMPSDLTPAQRLTLLVLTELELRDGEARVSHRELAELVGHSRKSSQRSVHALQAHNELAIEPCFWSDDHQQTANTYAVLSLPLDPPDKMTGGRVRLADQQKEISEETSVPPAAPVDNRPPVDDPTPEDRAALAAVVGGLKFPEPENVPDPEPGSALAAVCDRWGWPGYGQVWKLLQSREGRSLAHVTAPALAALLKRSAEEVQNPAGYVLSTMRTMAKTNGPGLRGTRPPDTPEARRLMLISLRDACPPGERRNQLSLAIFELSREALKKKAGAS